MTVLYGAFSDKRTAPPWPAFGSFPLVLLSQVFGINRADFCLEESAAAAGFFKLVSTQSRLESTRSDKVL